MKVKAKDLGQGMVLPGGMTRGGVKARAVVTWVTLPDRHGIVGVETLADGDTEEGYTSCDADFEFEVADDPRPTALRTVVT